MTSDPSARLSDQLVRHGVLLRLKPDEYLAENATFCQSSSEYLHHLANLLCSFIFVLFFFFSSLDELATGMFISLLLVKMNCFLPLFVVSLFDSVEIKMPTQIATPTGQTM